MPRLPRYVSPGVPMHVIQRGHNRQAVFLSAEDGKTYVEWLREAAAQHGLAVHAYVLMTNHLHLLATPATATALPLTMKAVNQRYTPYLNRRLGRTGTAWEGRYRATVVDSERYFLAVSRYIELNPVRAGLTIHPASHRFSSFKANALGLPDSLIIPHAVYNALGPDEETQQSAYRALFETDLDEETLTRIRDCTHKGWALGDERFAATITNSTGRQSQPLPRGRKPKRATSPK